MEKSPKDQELMPLVEIDEVKGYLSKVEMKEWR